MIVCMWTRVRMCLHVCVSARTVGTVQALQAIHEKTVVIGLLVLLSYKH